MSFRRILCLVAAIAIGLALSIFTPGCSESPTSPPASNETIVFSGDLGTENQMPPVVTRVDCLQGNLPGGALYEICLPDEWNGDVLIYAHGYVRVQDPVALPDDEVGDVLISELITSMGYAYASTSYRRNGLVVPVAVEDLRELADVIRTDYPQANHLFLGGVSEGGLITTLAVEKYPGLFDGGMCACGPIGNFRLQLNYLGNFRIVFDYFFPGVIPGSPVEIPQEVIDNWDSYYKSQVIAAINNSPGKTQQLIRVTRAPIDEADPSSVENTVIGILEYNVFGTNDAVAQLGGQPVDNQGKLYYGSEDDWQLNRGVQRFEADPEALDEMFERYQGLGRLEIPLAAIHTTRDEIVSYQHQVLYLLKVILNGRMANYSNMLVNRYGHCNFEQSEILAAFAVMIRRATAADLILASSVLPSWQDQQELLSLAEAHGASPRIVQVDNE
jgi:pimeloyl-ACP methyl ester carboxylesterase